MWLLLQCRRNQQQQQRQQQLPLLSTTPTRVLSRASLPTSEANTTHQHQLRLHTHSHHHSSPLATQPAATHNGAHSALLPSTLEHQLTHTTAHTQHHKQHNNSTSDPQPTPAEHRSVPLLPGIMAKRQTHNKSLTTLLVPGSQDIVPMFYEPLRRSTTRRFLRHSLRPSRMLSHRSIGMGLRLSPSM